MTTNETTDLSSPPTGGGQGAIPLSEGSFTIDKTKLFVPFDEEKDDLQERSAGSLLVEIQPFLVVTTKDILLLDAGLGFEKEGELQLHANIKKAGYHPNDVTKVLMTHLHKDHAGGLTYRDNIRLSFSNATYYIQKRELDFALSTEAPSFLSEELQPLLRSSQLELLNTDEGIIDGYIHYQVTGGHSPYHQVFWIKENGETIFFGGDVAPQLHQMKIRYKTKYDYDPQKALDLRQQWWKEGQKEGWKFLFYHDIKTPISPLFSGRESLDS